MTTDAALAGRPPLGLLRILGLVFGMAVVVGGIIGSGIMRAPGLVAQSFTTGPLILVAWAVGGAAAMLAAMPLVEAGAAVPLAGGPFPIAERAFGRTAGFFTGWMSWLAYTASSAFIASVFGEYVHRLGFLPHLSTNLLACGLILLVAAINWTGTRISGASQSIASAAKGAVFIVLIVILFLSPRSTAPAPAHAVATLAGLSGAIMAVRLIYQTYAGWDAAIYFSEEVQRPDRNVARSTFWGIGLCAAVYVLINAAVLHVLSPAQVAGSSLAVGDAAKVSLGPAADLIITGFGLFSLAAIVNLQAMVATRVTYRMARDGSMPTLLGKVAQGGTPRWSLVLHIAVAILFAATGGYESIVKIYAPWTIGSIFVVILSQIRLRYSEPELARPWRVPLFPVVSFLAALVQGSLLAVVMWDDPRDAALSAVVVLAPIPIYLLAAKRWRASATAAFG